MTVPLSPHVALDASPVDVSSKPATCGIVTYKVKVPFQHWAALNTLEHNASNALIRMLAYRNVSSSKDYPEIPCVVAKALVRKYQRDIHCKGASRVCIPVCGDKGKQVKITGDGIRVSALFKKAVIPCQFPLPIIGFIRQIECFKRGGEWFMSYTYNTPCAKALKPVGVIGVDRNSVGNVAVMASTVSGKVRHIGINADRWKLNFRRRKARVMSQGRKRLASRLRRKQSRRTKFENHRIAKGIVAFAASQNCALSLEDLKLNKGAKRYADTRQWSHAQLLGFIQYKAALRGVPIVFCTPAYTSQDCSRCGQRNKPDGKKYVCKHCNSESHRDTNAAWNIAKRGAALIGIGEFQVSSRRGLLTNPSLGNERQANIYHV